MENTGPVPYTALEVPVRACYRWRIMHRNDSRSYSAPVSGISVVIPTCQRGPVLLETLVHLMALDPPPDELLIVDQTERPEPEVAEKLGRLEAEGKLRWLRYFPPSIPRAMNQGLLRARGDVVLFLDDDVIPQPNLLRAHHRVYADHPEVWAVAGRVLQPEDEGTASPAPPSRPDAVTSVLRRDLRFSFAGDVPAVLSNVIACHLSVRRRRALAIGGFDSNFIPPVSYRFETEFARRLVAAGGQIRFEPEASLRHLRAAGGGTRAQGRHLASASPVHGVGDYYYALRWGTGWDRVRYIARRPFREVCTRFHLTHPWFIPVKLIGELRAMVAAVRLARKGPDLLASEEGEAP